MLLTTLNKQLLMVPKQCSKIFENGFISHHKISSLDSDALNSINDGYKFFGSDYRTRYDLKFYMTISLLAGPSFQNQSNEQKNT